MCLINFTIWYFLVFDVKLIFCLIITALMVCTFLNGLELGLGLATAEAIYYNVFWFRERMNSRTTSVLVRLYFLQY
jgi:hypothetical protein